MTTVAMASTGVYWIPLFALLEARGLQVLLIDPRQAKHVPGRPKTDRLDYKWLVGIAFPRGQALRAIYPFYYHWNSI